MSRAFSSTILAIMAISLAALMAVAAFSASVSADQGSLAGYSCEKSHVITGSPDGDLSDYQLKFIVHRGTGTDSGPDVYLGGHSQSWPDDIRFSNPAGDLLSYWIESSDADTAVVWVKVGSIPQSPASTAVLLFYGKAGDSGAGDGRNTFLFFDDFSSGDSQQWNTGGSPAFGDGTVNLHQAGDYLQSVQTFDPGSTATRAKLYTGIPSDYFTCFGYGGYQRGGGWGYLDQSGAYVWFEYGAARNIRWFIGSNITLTGPPLTAGDTWHVYDVYTSPARQTVYVDRDGALVLSGSSKYAISGAKSIFFGRHNLANGTADVEADWILVRKHTITEPVHGGWTQEQPQGVPTGVPVATATPVPGASPVQSSPTGYSQVKPHVLTGSPDGDLSSYQVQFRVHRGLGADSGNDVYLGGNSQSWPNDIRFTGSDGTPLSYWTESATDNSAVVWVKIPCIPSSGTYINLLYGKAGDPGASDGPGTFEFFTDFDDLGAFDQLGTIYASDGVATIQSDGTYWSQLVTRQAFPDGSRIRCRLKSAHSGTVPDMYELFYSAADATARAPSGYEQANYCCGQPYSYYDNTYELQNNGLTGLFSLKGWSAGQYHLQELDRHGLATFTVDDGNRIDCGPENYNTGTQQVGIRTFRDSARVDVDWLFVAKYAEHEPGHGAWGATGQLTGTSTPTPELHPLEVSPGATDMPDPTVTQAPSPSVATPILTATPGQSMATPTPFIYATPLPVGPVATPVKTQSGLSQLTLLLLGAVALFVLVCAMILAVLILIVVIDQRINK